MKVGTDSVVLGAWVNIGESQCILDIGTGSGVISLMMAQRSTPTTHIDGVELEAPDASQALQNVLKSPWTRKISIHRTSIQEFKSSYLYDTIVSNPPYFVNSSHASSKVRTQTRHNVSLDYDTLLNNIKRLLKGEGKANVIIPATEGQLFTSLAQGKGLYPSRNVVFRTRPEKPAERLLLELSYTKGSIEHGEILLYREGSSWSNEYKELVEGFYMTTC